jgi:NADH-quinone oxidoreductase subunit M
MEDLARVHFPHALQLWSFPLLWIGFGSLAGVWPFHTWSPDGHASAPTAVSMLHAGVLMKLGAYGVLRVAMTLLPEATQYWAPLVGTVAVINVVYGAFIGYLSSVQQILQVQYSLGPMFPLYFSTLAIALGGASLELLEGRALPGVEALA